MGVPLFAFEGVELDGDDGTRVLDGVDAEIPEGGVTCLVGRSGSGKSSLLRMCNRLAVPSAGAVRFRGVAVDELDPLALRRRASMVFQRPTTFPGSVRDNLATAAPAGGDGFWAECLERADLPAEVLGKDVSVLSGGEAQRVCLARALATEPDVLLLDEPTSALDATARNKLEELARRVADSCAGVVWVSHDHAQVRRLADHVLVLDSGRVVAAGTPSAVAAHLDG